MSDNTTGVYVVQSLDNQLNKYFHGWFSKFENAKDCADRVAKQCRSYEYVVVEEWLEGAEDPTRDDYLYEVDNLAGMVTHRA